MQKIADKFAERSFHIKIVFFTVPRPELNYIEMIWSTMKRKTAATNMTLSPSTVEDLTRLLSIPFRRLSFRAT